MKQKWSRVTLSMNRLVATPAKAWGGSRNRFRPPAHAGCYASAVMSMASKPRRLSMNRRVRARGLHCVGRVPRPGGSWSQCAPNLAWGLSMNLPPLHPSQEGNWQLMHQTWLPSSEGRGWVHGSDAFQIGMEASQEIPARHRGRDFQDSRLGILSRSSGIISLNQWPIVVDPVSTLEIMTYAT